MIFFIGVLAVATVTDLRQRKIPNWCVGAGMAVGLALSFWQGGASQLAASLIQTAVVFVLFYPFYLIRGLGAGDVKLLMLLGCYLDKAQLERSIAATMLLAFVPAAVKLILWPEARANLRHLGGCTRKLLRTGAWDGYTPVVTAAGTVRLAPGVLVSVLLLLGGWLI